MECPYPDCKFVAAPGQVAEDGVCPGCDRPYKSQPTPSVSDMAERDMPAPGEEDMGGNPLQEGILGDYQNRGVRDESFASVRKGALDFHSDHWASMKAALIKQGELSDDDMAKWSDYLAQEHRSGQHVGFNPQEMANEGCPLCAEEHDPFTVYDLPETEHPLHWGHAPITECPNCGHGIEGARLCPHCQHPLEHNAPNDIEPDVEIPAEIVDVLPPDPGSIRPDKKRMDRKDAGLLNSIEDVAAPVVGGTAGFLVGGPAGAAVGAGLAGGAMDAAQGEGAGKAIGTGMTDALMGGGAGLGGAALGLESIPSAAGAAGDIAAGDAAASVSSGATADAAASGTTRGGVGSLMKGALNSGAANKLKNYYLMHQAIKGGENAVNNAYQSEMTPPATMGQPVPTESPSYFSHTAAKNDTPSSHDEVPSNDTDDPEEVDFKERNQGDTESKGLDLGEGINDTGGTDLGPDDFFSPDSEALKSLAELLPKVIEFAVGDQSGQDDPDLQDLHNKLEAEMPGYLDHANDDHGVKLISLIVGGTPDGSENGGDPLLQDNDEAHDPLGDDESIHSLIQAHVESALVPGLEGTCPFCGSVTDPSSAHCPQCGVGNTHNQPQPTNPDFETPQQMANPPIQSKVAEVTFDGQGPNTDEQKAAVAQLLQDEGRAEEIPNMILNPQEYADELAQIQQQEDPPEDIGQPGPPPPVEPTEQQGNMPMPGMSAPPPGQAMASAIAKYAGSVDGVAEKCPNCGSHSTGYTDVENGEIGCKTCGHHWKGDALVTNKEALAKTAEHGPAEANPLGVPLAEAEGPRDVEKEDDSSHTWIDSQGQPLHVGQAYEMYSENYEIPDRVKITAVKPDVIEFELIGEYGLGHETDLTHEEANIENISFVPSDQPAIAEGEPNGEGNLDQNMDDVPRPGPGQETDASTPHEMMASTHEGAFWNRKPPAPDLDTLMAAYDKIYGRDEWQNFLRSMLEEKIKNGEHQPVPPTPGLTDGIAGGPQAVPPEQRVASPESISMEPNWEGMRAWVLNMARTDLANAVNINDSMGHEGVPVEQLAQAAGVSPEEVIGLGGGALDDLRELPETEHPQLGHEGAALTPPQTACPNCGGSGIDRTGGTCFDCQGSGQVEDFSSGPLQPSPHVASDENVETGPEWLMEGVERTAGAHMTPWEQREYVEEEGVARNADKLSLGGTHYEYDDLADSFLFGL